MTQRSIEGGGTGRDMAVARLDELIRDLVGREDSPNALVREHLEQARTYLMNSMPAEYQLNLKMAADGMPALEDKDLRRRLDGFLKSQRPAE